MWSTLFVCLNIMRKGSITTSFLYLLFHPSPHWRILFHSPNHSISQPLTWTPTCHQRSLANIHPLHFTPMCSIPWQYDQPPLLPITTSSPIYPSNITPPTPSPSPPNTSLPPPPFKSLCIRPTLQCHRLIQIGRLRFPLIANANFCFQQINRCVFLISLRLSNRFVRFLLFLF